MLVNAAVGFAGNGRADAVVDSEGAVTFALGFAEGSEGVDCFPGLADGEDEGVLIEGGVAVTEFRGVFDFDGDAGEAFDEVFGDEAGVPGGTAGEEENAVDPEKFLGGEVQSTEDGGAAVVGEAATHAVFKGGGLLKDFLFHEAGKVAEFGGGGVPVDLLDDGFDVGAGGSGDAEVVGAEVHHFVVVEVNDVGGAMGEGADVGSEEVFAFAEPDDEGGATARADEFTGAILANDRDAKGALDVGEAFADRFEEAVFIFNLGFLGVVVGDEVGEGFGIGLGFEGISLLEEEFFHAEVIFNDPVVDDRNGIVAAGMGVGVCLGNIAVGGPAGMADAEFPAEVFPDRVFEFDDAPGAPDGVEGTLAQSCQTGGVVTPVFKSLQSIKHHAGGAILTNIANNSTHKVLQSTQKAYESRLFIEPKTGLNL